MSGVEIPVSAPKAREFLDRWAPVMLVAAAAAVAYANTLGAAAFVWDDRPIIALNDLLRSWSSLPRLFCVGYWESAGGYGTPVQEYRPVLMASYFLTRHLLGPEPWAFHLGNLVIHAANGVLLWTLLRRHYSRRVSTWASLLFALLPIHVEAVSCVTGRSELLACFWLLCAWSDMEFSARRPERGIGWFVLALLTKEQAVVFPAVLALQDWAFHRRSFWERGRRGLYLAMAGCAAGYVSLRWVVLGRAFHAGRDYFAGRSMTVRGLTMARFAWAHYLAPMLTGMDLRFDYFRPLIPDETGGLVAWACAAAWVLLSLEALRRWRRAERGARAAFWILGALAFFLPASNLLVPLDSIGGERFMYFPSIGFCVLLVQAVELAPPIPASAVLAGLAFWYGGRTAVRNRVWLDEGRFFQAAMRENPVSPAAAAGWGSYLAREGRMSEAVEALKLAMARDPESALPYYDLGRIYFERGDLGRAETLFLRASARDPGDPDTWIFLALLAEKREDFDRALFLYRRALRLRPWDTQAHFNAARILQAAGRRAEAAEHWREYLRLDPSNPDASRVRVFLAPEIR